MKPKVLLYEYLGLGLIIPFPSGVIYSNQAGGSTCLQPEMEGIFVPLRNDHFFEGQLMVSPVEALMAYFDGEAWQGTGATGGLTEHDADMLDQFLRSYSLSDVLRIDRSRLRESCEAWIHVEVTAEERKIPTFSGFGAYPRTGVLTWPNTD